MQFYELLSLIVESNVWQLSIIDNSFDSQVPGFRTIFKSLIVSIISDRFITKSLATGFFCKMDWVFLTISKMTSKHQLLIIRVLIPLNFGVLQKKLRRQGQTNSRIPQERSQKLTPHSNHTILKLQRSQDR